MEKKWILFDPDRKHTKFFICVIEVDAYEFYKLQDSILKVKQDKSIPFDDMHRKINGLVMEYKI